MTPGPWKWCDADGDETDWDDPDSIIPDLLVGSDGKSIIRPKVAFGVSLADEDAQPTAFMGVNNDDAILIAAAPDLLAACIKAVDLLDSDGLNSQSTIVQVCRAAIAKATGEQP